MTVICNKPLVSKYKDKEQIMHRHTEKQLAAFSHTKINAHLIKMPPLAMIAPHADASKKTPKYI